MVPSSQPAPPPKQEFVKVKVRPPEAARPAVRSPGTAPSAPRSPPHKQISTKRRSTSREFSRRPEPVLPGSPPPRRPAHEDAREPVRFLEQDAARPKQGSVKSIAHGTELVSAASGIAILRVVVQLPDGADQQFLFTLALKSPFQVLCDELSKRFIPAGKPSQWLLSWERADASLRIDPRQTPGGLAFPLSVQVLTAKAQVDSRVEWQEVRRSTSEGSPALHATARSPHPAVAAPPARPPQRTSITTPEHPVWCGGRPTNGDGSSTFPSQQRQLQPSHQPSYRQPSGASSSCAAATPSRAAVGEVLMSPRRPSFPQLLTAESHRRSESPPPAPPPDSSAVHRRLLDFLRSYLRYGQWLLVDETERFVLFLTECGLTKLGLPRETLEFIVLRLCGNQEQPLCFEEFSDAMQMCALVLYPRAEYPLQVLLDGLSLPP